MRRAGPLSLLISCLLASAACAPTGQPDPTSPDTPATHAPTAPAPGAELPADISAEPGWMSSVQASIAASERR
jgi:hypothetical protein